MEHVYLISFGEIGLKGKNRPFFETILINRIKKSLSLFKDLKVYKTHGRIFVETKANSSEVINRLKRIFGIVGISPALRTGLNLEDICNAAVTLLEEYDELQGKTFKVEARRSNKSFPYKSPEIARHVGAYVLKNSTGLVVDVHKPQITINVEVREKAYVYIEKVSGPGGLPIGVSGKALLLLSGGIDSPVAGWLTMKRGVEVQAIYFHSFPFTSDRAKEKVIDLCRVLAEYSGIFRLHVVSFTEVLKILQKNTPNELLTILMRRMMVRIAQKVAKSEGCLGLVTGESIGQVASQTLESLMATNQVAEIPVFRPLIAMDKKEIIQKAEEIGTFEISTRPFEDCCSLFVPEHPKTRPDLNYVIQSEQSLDINELIEEGLKNIEVINISPEDSAY
ncbi:MAG: tRNA uracil 4-sulfurtransferase [Thermosediminibacterales bacterium]|nr:tRNA uracil 4-sulfurtransferase [Thermosediminibacterales bacterium]